MIPGFLENQQEESKSDSFNDQFIEEYIQTQKAKIQTRKLIQEMLFFASCQVASASLAIILFQFAVQVLFTTWLCLFVAWIPSLSGLCEVSFQRTDEGWQLKIMNRPLVTIVKFVSGVAITTATIYSVTNELNHTVEQINQTYAEIQQYETPRIEQFLPPYFVPIVLAAIGIVLIGNSFRKPFD
jgi:hypothetical protein